MRAKEIRIPLFAARPKLAPLEEPQGWRASPALPRGLMPGALRISRLVHEGFFYRFRVSINHRQVVARRAFWAPAPLLPFLERARADGIAPREFRLPGLVSRDYSAGASADRRCDGLIHDGCPLLFFSARA